MTRENIETLCQRVSAGYNKSSVCKFAKVAEASGFIDVSQGQDGSRGLVFYNNKAVINFSGKTREIYYKDIKSVQIISSFEDFFADELLISGEGFEFRISDYSLDKSELKKLLEELCRDDKKEAEHKLQAEKYARIIAEKLAESALRPDNASSENEKPQEPEENFEDIIIEDGEPVISEAAFEIPNEKPTVPESYAPMPIPEEKINWLSGENYQRRTPEAVAEAPAVGVMVKPALQPREEESAEKKPGVPEARAVRKENSLPAAEAEASVRTADKAPEEEELPTVQPVETASQGAEISGADTIDNEDESAVREQIQNMSREETMSFLAQSLNEINSPEVSGNAFEETRGDPEENLQTIAQAISEISALPEEKPKDGELTVEPIWGDIYIKASRNLREVIESGKLTMEQIECELRDKLLDSARAFAKITEDESKIPKVLIPRITELKAAADNFDSYFKSGEDIAVRAMFFMMYQMLSYSDRIAETPETKERLNDFFRRFGPAGISLSMLDMRV